VITAMLVLTLNIRLGHPSAKGAVLSIEKRRQFPNGISVDSGVVCVREGGRPGQSGPPFCSNNVDKTRILNGYI